MSPQDFDFNLPRELIAQTPARPRNHARLLVYERTSGRITDDYFYALEKYLPAGATIVLNDSRVEKCRLKLGDSEVFILETINPRLVRALVRPGSKFKPGKNFEFEGVSIKTAEVEPEGTRLLELSQAINSKLLAKYQQTPFPPYIAQNEKLASEYQTVYARPPGSKAAPTAGLHFTKAQLNKLAKNHPIAPLTLHVGLGTFAPLRPENLATGRLHAETFALSQKTADALNGSSAICAVGTTSARVLESLSRPFKAESGQTDIFIRPSHSFKNCDSLITNFHLPKTSLLMLVAAFAGSREEILRVYAHAIRRKYRFYSFGDAMLIL